jgi:hypothetical protein
MSEYALYYGKDEPLPVQIPLRAGPWTLIYEGGDLRYLRLGDALALLRIYVALRDKNWGTVPATLTLVEQTVGADAFRIVYDAEHRQGDVDFVWRGTLTGAADGTLTFDLDGEARSTFLRNRLGFCLLHPAACAGARCRIEHMDGTTSTAPLPEFIVPDQPVPPFAEMRALTQEVAPGLKVRMELEGDTFEMEDQRNWTDASYKTFCTPLRLPYPVEVSAGTRIHQRITLRIEGDAAALTPAARAEDDSVRVAPTGEEARPLPAIGLGLASVPAALRAAQVARLKALHPAHLRADPRLAEADWLTALERAVEEAKTLGAPLEIALRLPDSPAEALRQARQQFDRLRPEVARWLVYPAVETFKRSAPPPHGALLAAARAALADYAPGTPFAAGTNSDFIFVNRYPPPQEGIDAFAFAINPQVHAFDNASLVETLGAQAAVVRSAQRLAGGKPVVISAVTLLPRFNPYAAAPEPWSPPPADPRQKSLFGAGWTLGSVKYLAESGAASVTYYETIGAGGVMEREQVFPLYHVLADIGAFAGGQVVPMRSSDPLKVEVLRLKKEGRMRLLLANMTAAPQQVSLSNVSGDFRLHRLDETNAEAAMQSPETYRAQPGEPAQASGEITLTLRPYAIARIDLT